MKKAVETVPPSAKSPLRLKSAAADFAAVAFFFQKDGVGANGFASRFTKVKIDFLSFQNFGSLAIH